jgi:HD-GYP domain-containing protein (c-di-GMP phosphodiesterase class II)
LLHDVGKIGVREEVLNKTTRIPPALLDVIFLRLDMRERESGEPAAPAKERLSAINVKPFLEREDVVLLHSLRESRFGPAASPLLTGEEAAALLVPSGNLSRDERKEIERHPGESFRILRHIPFTREFSNLLEIIHQHHERLDGSGYPRGLSGEEILLQARLLAVVDTFDAVTQKRHYKPALPRAKALDVLREEAEDGRMDAGLVDLFVERVDEIMENAEQLEQASGREPISQPAYRA